MWRSVLNDFNGKNFKRIGVLRSQKTWLRDWPPSGLCSQPTCPPLTPLVKLVLEFVNP